MLGMHWRFFDDSQFSSDMYAFKPFFSIQYFEDIEQWACFYSVSHLLPLCEYLVYRFDNISTQITFWEMIAMQFVCKCRTDIGLLIGALGKTNFSCEQVITKNSNIFFNLIGGVEWVLFKTMY